MRVAAYGVRTKAKARRDAAIKAANAIDRDTTEGYLRWSEARHQAWQAYIRAVLDVAQ